MAIITLLCLVWASVTSLRLAGPLQGAQVAATVFLVSPLMLLLWAHMRMASGWRQNAWLALCAIPLAYASFFAAFLMAWFKPGWYGVAVFTTVLCGIAALCLLPLRRKNCASG